MQRASTTDALLDGARLRATFSAAAHHLRERAAALNAINVYPVPDGDTGANMSATLNEAIARSHDAGERPTVAAVLQELARGALYGARGNSGVILSQALRGFAGGVGDVAAFDAAALARGLESASTAAYAAVSEPKEGTMLTVLRFAAGAATRAVRELPGRGAGTSCEPSLAAAVAAAETAEANTINELPALKDAGVPDAGGEGICVILRGLLAALGGEAPVPRPELPRPLAPGFGDGHTRFGHCTEFIIEPHGAVLDLERLRAVAAAGGNQSVVVVGDESLARVHVHTLQPEALIAAIEDLGTVSRVKIEDMTAQQQRFSATGSGANASVAVLAMSRGAGFDAVFESLGAAVSDIGSIEKPSAGQIADAANALGVPDVIVLPNHQNVLLAANQASSLARCNIHVVPTRSLPQGIAATFAFDADNPVADNVAAMTSAASTVRTIEVTTASTDSVADGVAVSAGQAIALLDGRLVAAEGTPMEALSGALRRIGTAGLLTIYGGEDASPALLDAAAASAREALPDAEVEVLAGGQPLYIFVVSAEA